MTGIPSTRPSNGNASRGIPIFTKRSGIICIHKPLLPLIQQFGRQRQYDTGNGRTCPPSTMTMGRHRNGTYKPLIPSSPGLHFRRIEDAGSQANQFAIAKAIASGDSRLMRKAGLESEIARLQRQHAAHIDDQHAIRRQTREAQHDQMHAEGRIRVITSDLARRQSTRGDAFTMEIEGRTITQRKIAGASLLTKIRIAARERLARRWTVGRIGGFDLTCDIRPGRRDERLQPELVLERSDFPQSIDIDGETTAIGIIARLEHVLDRMETEIEEQRRRVTDAKARLAGFEPRIGELFPLQGELDAKLAKLAEIEADLASTEGVMDRGRSVTASV